MLAKMIIALIIAMTCSGVATGHLNTTELIRSSIMSEQIITKRCSNPNCNQIFPATIEYFHRSKTRGDGLQPYCKQCQQQNHKRNYEQNIAERRQKARQYSRVHKAERLQYQKQYQNTIKGHLLGVWHNILDRCYKPENRRYKDYGGRGIKNNFVSFKDFYDYVVNELKADPRYLTIDRIDNDGHYERGNIRFVTRAENNRNR